jgi:hypothetical protein
MLIHGPTDCARALDTYRVYRLRTTQVQKMTEGHVALYRSFRDYS